LSEETEAMDARGAVDVFNDAGVVNDSVVDDVVGVI
jgi:hypothetical protein